MQFCPGDIRWSQVWHNDGVNRCFFDSVSSFTMFLVVLVLGVIQCAVYWRHALPLKRRARWLWLYPVQIVFTVMLLVEGVVHMILQDVHFSQGLHGTHVFSMFMCAWAYVMSLVLLATEKSRMLPQPYDGTHSHALLAFWGVGLARENLALVSWWNPEWWWGLDSEQHHVEFGLWLVRCFALLGLVILDLMKKRYQTLLSYTAPPDTELKTMGKDADDEEDEKRRTTSAWSDVGRKMKVMMHFIWPRGNRVLQLIVFICAVLIAGGRVISVYIPLYGKQIVNSLTGIDQQFRWDLVMIYCALLYLKGAGGGGLLNQIRGLLWMSVQQFTSKRMEVHVFTHLHSLSLRWHLERKTGKVLRIVERGTASMNTLLAQVAFQIVPTLIDCVIAIVFFISSFSYLFGLIILTCVAFYIGITFVMTELRTKYRRAMNKLDNEVKAHAVDSLLNFETVKYYGATDFEISRYQDAIAKYQKAEWKGHSFFVLWQWIQNTIFTMGYVAGLLLSAWSVVKSVGDSQLTVGDYVLLGTYLTQLFGPLNSLGSQYRVIQQSFIDVELMFDLLDKEPEVKDSPDAEELRITEGKIQFKDVCFHYNHKRPILQDINFTVLPGQTYAITIDPWSAGDSCGPGFQQWPTGDFGTQRFKQQFTDYPQRTVGHSGSGKSTIVRLLFRFYDVSSGTIRIDGKDIAKVTQNSLRNSIGVVPQETVLFNRDIKYNIRYGCVTADDAEVEEAAKAAEIHFRIQEFPYKYETVVGERGLKLSGGEKQRVAIARTLLKAPAILLLDEATSALDTKTERNIQTALSSVCENRTTIIISHRLSTIVHANQILVLHKGRIVERGTHNELLAMDGHYASMWKQQLREASTDPDLPSQENMERSVEDDTKNPFTNTTVSRKETEYSGTSFERPPI